MSRFARRIETLVPKRSGEFGGKVQNLAALARAGFPVPAAVAISSAAADIVFGATLKPEDRPPHLLSPECAADRLSTAHLAGIADQIRRAELPDEIKHALHHAWNELTRSGAKTLVVRSSSTREDHESSSAAGLHTSILGVTDEPSLIQAVRDCWASLFEPRAIAYFRAIPDRQIPSMGLVIQALVPADVSGALFTVNPLTGDPDEVVINATYGIGNPLMDGRISPDTYRFDRVSRFLQDHVVGDKSPQTRFVPGRGILEEETPESERKKPALQDDALRQLVDLGLRVEKHFGSPRDLEWAFAGQTLYLLQARPITALPERARRSKNRRTNDRDRSQFVWSNVNVGEALPGVATPLTWSILREFSELGFRRAFGSIGCSVPKDAELIGSFRGRIYLNLSEFMSIASQVPGLRPDILLSFGGGGEAARLAATIQKRSSFGFLSRLPLTTKRYVEENRNLTGRVADFETWFNERKRRMQGMDLRILSPAALAQSLGDVEHILDETGALTLTCYGNLLSTTTFLRYALKFAAPQRSESIELGLLTGLADVESATPGIALWQIAELGSVDPLVRDRIIQHQGGKLRVEDLPQGPIRRALELFIRAHGFRGPREAEIAEPRWSEDASLLFTTLRIHWQRAEGMQSPLQLEAQRSQIRSQAIARLEEDVRLPLRMPIRHLLTLVHKFMRLRERMRAHVIEVLGMFRRVALEASRRLLAREPDCGPDAAFFLTLEELQGVLRDESKSIASLVRRRRAQFERDQHLPPPPDTFVGTPPAPELLSDVETLVGVGASGGYAEGNARILLSPSDASAFLPGEILVAPYADVGWSPLFLVAKALVTDLGGSLSHASVVAREYGVPAVVNVKQGTRLIRTGDRISVDGETGIVRILQSAAPEPRT